MTLIVAARGKPKERVVRVLLDDGAQVPVLSQHIAIQLNIPRWKHEEPLSLQAWDGSTAEGGVEYGGPVMLRHKEDHFTKLSLELAPLDDEVDVLLPYWWLQQHRPEGFFDGPNHVTFGSTYCKEHCTSLAVQGKTGCIASLAATAPGDIPQRFRDAAPLIPVDPQQRLP
ncbi:hypothetical protein QBC35DRAFT_510663, partial [Podospora australis]